MITDAIYIIQEECLRKIKGGRRDYLIWCATEVVYGYTPDYIEAEKELERLNRENKNQEIRYVITEVERLIKKPDDKTFKDNNGNDRCRKCGDKIEGGYCGCFNEVNNER